MTLSATDIGIMVALGAIVVAVVAGLIYYMLTKMDGMFDKINEAKNKLESIEFLVDWVKKVGTETALETFDRMRGEGK